MPEITNRKLDDAALQEEAWRIHAGTCVRTYHEGIGCRGDIQDRYYRSVDMIDSVRYALVPRKADLSE